MVLVTGATGFLGSELIRQLLQNGEKVRALKRESSIIPEILKDDRSVDWVNADILDYFSLEEALREVSVVYHCAAIVSFDRHDRKAMHRVNVEGTINLLNASMSAGVDKFLHVSSAAAVGSSKKDELITEDHHWEFGGGQSTYSISKYESEMEVFRAAAEGLNAVVVNPTIILGINAGTRGSGQIFDALRKGMLYYPDGSFGYVDVEDVAGIMIRLMKSDISGERFIINSENWTHKDFFSEASALLGQKPPYVALKPWMLELASYGTGILSMLTGKNFRLTRDTARSAFRKRNYSNEKVKKALNLEFKPVKDTISDICRNFNTINSR